MQGNRWWSVNNNVNLLGCFFCRRKGCGGRNETDEIDTTFLKDEIRVQQSFIVGILGERESLGNLPQREVDGSTGYGLIGPEADVYGGAFDGLNRPAWGLVGAFR